MVHTTTARLKSQAPSALEVALQAEPGQVCTNGTASGLKAQYVGMTPQALFNLKLPYFVHVLPAGAGQVKWREVWSEEFSFLNGQQGINSPLLRFTDNAMSAGVNPKPTFSCTRFAIDMWLLNGFPPSSTALQQQGCPAYNQNDFYN